MTPLESGNRPSELARRSDVVVGFDGSPTSLVALDWAAATAAAYGTGLTLLRARPDAAAPVMEVAVPSEEAVAALGEEAATALAAATARVAASHPEVAVTAVVHPDSPVRALLEQSASAKMVVVGSRGMEGFKGLLLGSTTMNVAPHARCPVAVLYEPDEETAEARQNAKHPQEVIVGYDGSLSADVALTLALDHAAATGLGVAVVVVTKGRSEAPVAEQVDPADDTLGEGVRSLLQQAARTAGQDPAVPLTYLHAVGRPAAVLINEASGAALAVVGARGLGGFAGLVMGSVSLQMLMHAECPVIVAHSVDR